jgi:hypothetical protein
LSGVGFGCIASKGITAVAPRIDFMTIGSRWAAIGTFSVLKSGCFFATRRFEQLRSIVTVDHKPMEQDARCPRIEVLQLLQW